MADGLLSRNVVEARDVFASLVEMEPTLRAAADALAEAMTGGRKLLACGNGGSAADAAHMTTEFVCRFNGDRRPYPAISLGSHGGDLTAIGNDYCFEQVFERQVRAFGQKGDVLLAVSTSGKSPNVRHALVAAKELGLRTIALLGKDGGDTRGLAEFELIVRHTVTARIQEAHKLLIHTLCESIEDRLRA